MIEDRFNVDQAEYYLDRMFGDREGFVALAFGHNPRMSKPRFREGDFRGKYYAWPKDRNALIDDVDDAVNSPETRRENVEVFICPSLRKTPSRSAGESAPLMWVWADMDHPPSQDQIDRINALGAMTVLSGTEGHRHIYLPLTAPVSPTTHQAMCRALRDAIGGDNKITENDLLRLPGTLNWKTTQPTQVWLKSVGRRAQPAKSIVDKLTSMTGKEWSEYKSVAESDPTITAGQLNDIPLNHPAPKRKTLPPLVRKAFDYQPDPGKRNNAIFGLIATCKEEGVTRADTHALVRTYPPAVSKWGSAWRISNDVDRIWQKTQGPENDPDQGFAIVEDDDGTDQPNLVFHTIGNLIQRVKNAPAPKYLFEDIVMEGDYGLISAEDKAGKSFVMMDAAVSAASGTPWVDKYITLTQGPVIICVGEGRERKQVRRIMAIGKHKGLAPSTIAALPLHIMLSVPTLRDADHLDELEAKIREVKPVLVIIDPFYLAAAGINLSQINEVGTVLKPLQAIIERHNTALMISHHWNKTGNGDPHSRASGVGLTAWGRFLISIEIKKASTDPYTRKTTVLQQWNIKGDEVMTEDFALERQVWTQSKDPTSDMFYSLTVPDTKAVARSEPVKYGATMEIISQILSENLDGLGCRAVTKLIKGQTGRSISTRTVAMCLDQLYLHGYAQEGKTEGRGHVKPFFHLEPFTREIHQAKHGDGSTPASRKKNTDRIKRRPATARGLDFTKTKG